MLVVGSKLVPRFRLRAPLAPECAPDSVRKDDEVFTLRLRGQVVLTDIGSERVDGSRHTREWLSRLPFSPLDRGVNVLRWAPESRRKGAEVEGVVQAVVTRAVIGNIFM